ncbi:MAG TPA: TIM barrel protein [Anaerolineae bacterium]
MDRHWSEFCTMSLVSFMAFPDIAGGGGPVVESLARIAGDDFFDGVELAWINDPQTRQEARSILAAGRLAAGFCAHPAILSQKLNLNSLDEDERRHAVTQMRGLIDQAHELNAARFVLLSGRDPGEAAREAAIEALVKSLADLCRYARPYGIEVVVETFDRGVDKKALIGPVADARRLAAELRRDHANFGLLYDLSHMPLLDESPADMAVIKEYLVHAHVGNCVKVAGRPLYGDLHPAFGLPGGENGVEQLAAFIQALFAIGYLAAGKEPKPWVGFEVKPQGPGQTPELIIANAKRTWRQAWALV